MTRPLPQLVTALDTRDVTQSVRIARKLSGIVTWMKVGLELFVHAGPDVVSMFRAMGFKVFLDLKMYDIPHTVYGGMWGAVAAEADMLTIHIQGGRRMAEAALKAADDAADPGRSPLILGVTVLTSMAPGELPGYSGDLTYLATHLATEAQQWGLHGIVSSGHEVRAIKERCGESFVCLTPGIRPSDTTGNGGGKGDDQHRTMTPAAAAQAGSDYLVVGRPITRAADPAGAARAILDEIQQGMTP